MTKPLLSITIPAYDEFTGLWATLTRWNEAIADAGALDLVEFVVCNNSPSKDGAAVKSLVADFGGTCVELPTPVGTAPARNAAIAAATGEMMLMIDAHVMPRSGVVPRLIEFCRKNGTDDLFYGVCLKSAARRPGHDADRIVWTNWKPEFGSDGMFGRSVIDPRGRDAQAPPFEIEHSGSGLFLCRRESFPGYHPDFKGFGIEGYITGEYKKAGRKVWCLPWLRWFHCFRKAGIRSSYPHSFVDRASNHLSMVKAGNPWITIESAKAANVGPQRLSDKQWQQLVERHELIDSPTSKPRPLGKPGTELTALLKELHIPTPPECECIKRAAQMDEWGVEGCRANIKEIVTWLRDSAKEAGWARRIVAAGAAVWNGVAWRVDPFDPIPYLIHEAIRRAKVKIEVKP